MKKEIFVDINPYQTRVVLCGNGAPSEIYIERRGRERLVGNIYKGRGRTFFARHGRRRSWTSASSATPSLRGGRTGGQIRIHLQRRGPSDTCNGMPNIRDIVKVGCRRSWCRSSRSPWAPKGAVVTTNITLPGRTLVLMPSVKYIGVSRRIEDESSACASRRRSSAWRGAAPWARSCATAASARARRGV